jgi:cell division protease FtsH
VVVPRPDIEGRVKILEVHTKTKPLAPDVDLRQIARGTPGFSGADLANLANEAALLAARKGKRLIANAEFEEAKDKVMMGAERRSMVMTEDEKKALVSLHVEGCGPLHKVTIIPRGRALGVTWNLPERDRFSMNMKQMKARLALCFGGRIAEQLIYGKDELNTGAANDIQQATDMARSMVMEYGMSEKLGWLRYRDNQDEVFLGHSVARTQSVSGETAKLIDQEVRRLVEEGEVRARDVLTKNIDELHKLAGALLEYETLSGEEAKRAIAGEPIDRPDVPSSPTRQIEGHAGSIPQVRRRPPSKTSGPSAQGA